MHLATIQEAVMHYAVRFSGMQSRRGNGFVPVRRGGHLTQSVSLVQLIDHLSQLDAHHQEANPWIWFLILIFNPDPWWFFVMIWPQTFVQNTTMSGSFFTSCLLFCLLWKCITLNEIWNGIQTFKMCYICNWDRSVICYPERLSMKSTMWPSDN